MAWHWWGEERARIFTIINCIVNLGVERTNERTNRTDTSRDSSPNNYFSAPPCECCSCWWWWWLFPCNRWFGEGQQKGTLASVSSLSFPFAPVEAAGLGYRKAESPLCCRLGWSNTPTAVEARHSFISCHRRRVRTGTNCCFWNSPNFPVKWKDRKSQPFLIYSLNDQAWEFESTKTEDRTGTLFTRVVPLQRNAHNFTPKPAHQPRPSTMRFCFFRTN